MKGNERRTERGAVPREQVGVREAHIVLEGLHRWLERGERQRDSGATPDRGELSALRLLVERAEQAAYGVRSDSNRVRKFYAHRVLIAEDS